MTNTMRNKFTPNYAVPPSESLKEMIEIKGLTVIELSNIAKIPVHTLNEILSANQVIDEQIAMALEQALGVSRSFWLNLQRNYVDTIQRLNQEKKTL